MDDALRVIDPVELPGRIPCTRSQLGPDARMGYKPNVVQLAAGELLLANFHTHYEVFDDGCMCEHIVLHRSADGGATWRSRHHDHLWGREPYLNLFSGDQVIITTHFLATDVRNQTGHTTVYLHRSADGGATWESTQVGVEMIPEEVEYTYTSRNIIELPDGSYLMGVGCGHDRDYRFRSTDRGRSWQVDKMTVQGFDNAGYEHSILQEGIFFRTESGRLLLFARCDPRRMVFDPPVPGIPEIPPGADGEMDHYDMEVVFESPDEGRTWRPVNAFPLLGCMYPSVCAVGDGKYLFTYTQRVPLPDRHMGVYALVLTEAADGALQTDVKQDVIVIDEKTPDFYDSGGGFGNTLKLRDGSLVTPYSYLEADPEVHELLRTGEFREREIFERFRRRALPYYRYWMEKLTWEKMREADPAMQYHMFMGCAAVLNLCGPVTEVCRWNLEV